MRWILFIFAFLVVSTQAWVRNYRSITLPPNRLQIGEEQQHQHQHQLFSCVGSSRFTSLLYVKSTVDETTEKYGLEIGLVESLKKKDGGESAKSLLKRYGIAYLATSIPLALISFTICYILIDNGVDVSGLLSNIGIDSNDAGEKAGTFALAYAAHKAASPIRFPPTVALTPIVAKLIGKEPNENNDDDDDNDNKE